MLKKWFISVFPEIEKISQTLAPKLCQKLWKIELLMKRCIGSANLTGAFFAFSQDITMLKKWIHQCISWNRKDISNSGPKAMPKIIKKWTFNEKVYRIRKTSQKRFRLFARYYDAEEVIHKRISWNWEDISNSGPKAMPTIIQNWSFNEKMHRIRKTSQSRFSLFCKILRCIRSDS